MIFWNNVGFVIPPLVCVFYRPMTFFIEFITTGELLMAQQAYTEVNLIMFNSPLRGSNFSVDRCSQSFK